MKSVLSSTLISAFNSSPDLPAGNDSWLREFLPAFFSTILVIPDNPEEGALYLIKSALNAINKYSWDRSLALKSLALLDGIKLIVSACQESYPYSYQVVTSLNYHNSHLLNIRVRATMPSSMVTIRVS